MGAVWRVWAGVGATVDLVDLPAAVGELGLCTLDPRILRSRVHVLVGVSACVSLPTVGRLRGADSGLEEETNLGYDRTT